MFTSSMSSFRHARNQVLTRSMRRSEGRGGGRMGSVVAALAVAAALTSLASPAAAEPGLSEGEAGAAVFAPEATIAPAQVGVDAIPSADSSAEGLESFLGDITSGDQTRGHEWGQVLAKQARAARRPVAPGRVMGVAAAQAGDRYVYGAVGPNAFDCSGLTSFVYRVAAGRILPHSSAAQAGVTQRITRAAARPGDLVFFHGPSGIYHVGIFAGGNSLIHASKPGVPVGRAQIWSSAVSFGRVR